MSEKKRIDRVVEKVEIAVKAALTRQGAIVVASIKDLDDQVVALRARVDELERRVSPQ